MSRYGEGRTNAMITETRQEYEALIPQLPYIGGKQPFTQFIIFRFKKGGPTRVAVPKSLERARR